MLDGLLGRITTQTTIVDDIVAKQNKVTHITDLSELIQTNNYLGELLTMTYKNATIQISDFNRHKVGGIPNGCFLLASKINPNKLVLNNELHNQEDYSVILLRVLHPADLPNDLNRLQIKTQNAENISSDEESWEDTLDATSKKQLSWAGLECRILGTFYMKKNYDHYELAFGSDISNFYQSESLKIYKPTEKALETIINFGVDEDSSIRVGKIRYSSTQRENQGLDNVAVYINPTDLIAQKTAIFGMTRTGKSNTVKTIVKAIYQKRFSTYQPKKIGQIIFDPNGEYANENTQDKDDKTGAAQAIKNLWKIPHNSKHGNPDDIKIYSLVENPDDPQRIIMKINFFDDKLIQIGKDLIDLKIETDGANTTSHYMRNFLNIQFERPEDDMSSLRRYDRKVLVYKTLLASSDYTPDIGKVKECKLFNEELIEALEKGIHDFEIMTDKEKDKVRENKVKYEQAAFLLKSLSTKEGVNYLQLKECFTALSLYIKDPASTYHNFNRHYMTKLSQSGLPWADTELEVLLNMFDYPNALRQIKKANIFHSHKASKDDYAKMIYKDLNEGRLVIIDQAFGDSQMQKIAAERITRTIFNENAKQFSEGNLPTAILIFIEEAHNLMPKGSEEDNTNIWARVAKEGAKFNIGMLYSTQEVSSIQRNILKNTTNWFISHLNNREEIRALEDYYDFMDFSHSILVAEDKGFIRMKTRSNKFIVPIQVDKFQVK